MLDFSEKKASFADLDGRMMSFLHRGDVKHYPENSIEGVISSCMMGVDIIECDVRLTKDSVAVLMHERTLTRTTNFSDVKGTTVNGIKLPTSENIADWTLEELRCLKLKEGKGGPNAALTEYVIPTLEEVLTVTKGRCFIWCDKLGDDDNLTAREKFESIILPLIKKTGAYDTVIMTPSIGPDDAVAIQEIVRDLENNTEGLVPFKLSNLSGSTWSSQIQTLANKGLVPFCRFSGLVSSGADLSQILTDKEKSFEDIKGTSRLLIDTYLTGDDNVATWDRCSELGLNVVWVEDSLAIQRYIATKHFSN